MLDWYEQARVEDGPPEYCVAHDVEEVTKRVDSLVKETRRDHKCSGFLLMYFSSSMSLLCCAKIMDRSRGASLMGEARVPAYEA